MKKIALAGLCEYINYGDQFIAKSVEYLVKSLEKDTQITFVSFERKTTGLKYFITQKMLNYSKKARFKNWSYKIQYLVIKIRFQKYFMEKLRGCEGLIFTCGSFKYTTQYLWAQYSIAVECCEKLNISVMFDAMDIQKYDGSDWRCLCLKKHLNSRCVKMITSRDGEYGVERLNKFYIENQKIKRYPVGDPAFWIRECYHIQKRQSNVIGINLIKADNFIVYGGTISADYVVNVYAELLKRLESDGYQYELFTNGMPIDEKTARLIEEKLQFEEGSLKVRVPKNDRDLVEIISGYKSILGARLHACICAYSLDVPMVGFVWAEKMQHFAEMAEISELFCTEDDFNAEKIYDKLKRALIKEYDIKNRERWKAKTKNTISIFLKGE